MQEGAPDIQRPEVLSVYEIVDDAAHAHGVQLVLVAHQHMLVGQPLHVL